MFSTHLFNHLYDIDDLIFAFCGEENVESYILDTVNGTVYRKKTAPDELIQKAKDEAEKHTHIIEPLPEIFIQELTEFSDFKRLADKQKEYILSVLKPVKHMHQLQATFEDEYVGGWIRHQIKEACLEWLDMHEMIPPSMRHTSDSSMFDFTGSNFKVNIQ